MKVRMRTTYQGVNGRAKPGQVVDVPEAEALQLLGQHTDKDGVTAYTFEFAEQCNQTERAALFVEPKASPKPETAAVASSETAAMPHPGRRSRG